MTQAIDPDRLAGILAFLRGAERLKDTLRSGHTSGGRPESTAEHSWRLTLMIALFARDLPGVDLERLLKLALIHDLGEAISGDVPAVEQRADDGREARERRDMETLCAPLPDDLRAELLALWEDYAAASTPEAVLVKGFDKLETILQHATGANPPDFDYGFNLDYGVARTDAHPLLRAIREAADAATRARMDGPSEGG
ncbi:HD domain-containing protein [Albimonas sp. CAU 1670]|uniref:HD domain-containing protein n=1 Tax=Albimonas sp. CAU 1670 TaxID=3032599 RepID=UPI0023DC5D3D|nr:HD domain-containing protein [Albimonas sp. CAU 1670]MDF2233318.1 HD domain-containing protein [Albimonas sp. CAU 1670]